MQSYRKNSLLVGIAAVALSIVLFMPNVSMAKKAKQVKFIAAATVYPEFGEIFGINMYLAALKGLSESHPDLKKQLKIKTVDRGLLCGSQDECLTMVSTGAAEMTYSAPHFLEQLMPEWKLGEYPGLYDDWAHFVRTMETPEWVGLQEKMAKEKGVTIVKWLFDTGIHYLFTDKGPIKSIEDLKGQKIRTPGGESYSKAVQALGSTAIAVPYTEVVTSLQTNMIDGLVTDLLGGTTYYGLSRYTKYLIPTPITIQPIAFVVNTEWWESLKPKAREAIMTVFDRIDLQTYYDTQQKVVMKNWDQDPKTILNELSAEESKRLSDVMRTGAEDVLKDLDPKYMKAILNAR